jgi:hypothetical protein
MFLDIIRANDALSYPPTTNGRHYTRGFIYPQELTEPTLIFFLIYYFWLHTDPLFIIFYQCNEDVAGQSSTTADSVYITRLLSCIVVSRIVKNVEFRLDGCCLLYENKVKLNQASVI